ncbi:MAG: aminotransferase class I/II-fold pyridoxal phosphate-dependent enzyme [Chloroflexota bacterium]
MHNSVAGRTSTFVESVIRDMTRRINQSHPAGGINLAQGFPDFSAPQILKDAASAAIQADVNQYAITWGARDFRNGIADKTRQFTGLEVDPEREITVTCGATEAMAASMLALVNPGDEVIIFEPFYENYGPDCALCGAVPRYVRLEPPSWTLNREALQAAFGPRTRAIVLNSPNNPTGKVFTRDELEFIAGLCRQWDCIAFTDEIYEHLVYDGATHVSLALIEGMRERTVVVNGLSKTYGVTGWRVGYVLAPAPLTAAIRKVHDFLTVGAPAPHPAAGTTAMHLPQSYSDDRRAGYDRRRDVMVSILHRAGFDVFPPHGAYYVMVDITPLGFHDDTEFAHWLVHELGVAVVPGSSFYRPGLPPSRYVRFAFPKRLETLERVAPRLESIRSLVRPATG